MPANRLPPEIISYIARFVLADLATDTRPIVPLTHICQYWRNSIVSTPGNWTLICNERESLAALSLERAKTAPLTIRLNMDKLEMTKHPRFRKILLSHIQYTRSLSLSGFYTTKELTRALPNFPKSMPNLQSMTLMNDGPAEQTQPIDPFNFPSRTLRVLSLHNIPLYPSFLGAGTLTRLTVVDRYFNIHLDTLLEFLGKSSSLESATLDIEFAKPSPPRSRSQLPIRNRLRHLSIYCYDAMDGQALISSVALSRGAALEIHYNGRLADLLSGVSMPHLPNLSSPTFMEYRSSSQKSIRWLGPNGSFSLRGCFRLGGVFDQSPSFPLDSIREFRLEHRAPSIPTEIHLSFFPSLEVLVIEHCICISQVLAALLQNPTYPPSLKTLAFLNCVITEGFMENLARLASERASLRRVVIVGSDGGLPSEALVEWLRKRVPVVEVAEGWELPTDMSQRGY